jgi:hypothetical protein
MFFSRRGGGGKRKRQVTFSRVDFRWMMCAFKQPQFLCYILYIEQWRFRYSMPLATADGAPDPRSPGHTRALFKFRQPDDLFHTLKTVKGLLLLVPPRTPRSSGYDVYAHAVYVVICCMSIACICLLYVVICYMSLKCYVSVMCLVLAGSCYLSVSVICCYMLCNMSLICYMSVICLV